MLLYFNQSIKPLELNGPFWYIRENKRIDHGWPTGCLVIPFMQKAEAGTYHLTGQLVIIIALHYHRKASATSANNEVAKTVKKGKVIESQDCRGRVLVPVLGSYTEYLSLHAYGSLDTCSNFGDYLTGTLLDWKQLNDILLLCNWQTGLTLTFNLVSQHSVTVSFNSNVR